MSQSLNIALKDELTRVIPVIQSTFTFAVSFDAAQKLLVGRAETGPYMVAITMTALLLLLGLNVSCKECQARYKDEWFVPVIIMVSDLLQAAVSLSVAFVSNLFATVLVGVISEILTDSWVIWWAALGLALTNIATRFIL